MHKEFLDFLDEKGIALNDEEVIINKDTALSPGRYTTLLLRIPKNARITLREDAGEGVVTILHLEEGSSVRYLTKSNTNIRIAYLEKDAHLVWIDAAPQSAVSQGIAYLAGEGANARLSGIFLGRDEEQYDVQLIAIHAAPHTKSNLLTRAVMLDNSKGKYRGIIKILPHANGSDAYQREDTLLLGDKSRMEAIPILEINNHDVRCSHGVTLGQIDDEKLFYLRSRGLRSSEATSTIVHGFFGPLLNSMQEHGDVLRLIINKRLEVQ